MRLPVGGLSTRAEYSLCGQVRNSSWLTTSNHINGRKNRIPVQPCASCEIVNTEINPVPRGVAEKFGVKEFQIANAISQRHWATASVAEQVERREHRKLGNKRLKQFLHIDGLRRFHFQFADAFKITNAEKTRLQTAVERHAPAHYFILPHRADDSAPSSAYRTRRDTLWPCLDRRVFYREY
jgi:hypothetical protein